MEEQDKSGKKEKTILEKIQGEPIGVSIDNATEKIIKILIGAIGMMLLVVIVIAIIKAAIKIIWR